jgi:hypothetical protein
MVRTSRGSFLRGFLERFLDNEHAHNRLTQPQYLRLQATEVCCECSTTRIGTCASSSTSGSLTFSTKKDFDKAPTWTAQNARTGDAGHGVGVDERT